MGSNGEVLVDQQLLRPCKTCRPEKKAAVNMAVSNTQEQEFCTSLDGVTSPASPLATCTEVAITSNSLSISC